MADLCSRGWGLLNRARAQNLVGRPLPPLSCQIARFAGASIKEANPNGFEVVFSVIPHQRVTCASENISDNIREQCKEKYQLTKSQIILSSSHTHSGPVIRESLYHIYPFSNNQIEKIENYSVLLENYIVTLIGKAFDNMIPAQLFSDNGVVRFQINRRNNNSETLSTQTDLNGPNDFAVPVYFDCSFIRIVVSQL